MSDVPASAHDARPLPQMSAPLEQRVFELSPVGALATAFGIFAVLMASFELAAAIAQYPLADQLKLSPQEGLWPAFILSLLVSVALGMQRYVRLKDIEDDAVLSHIFPCDFYEVGGTDLASRPYLRWAGVGGLIFGGVLALFVVPKSVQQQHMALLVWFVAVMAILAAMFARGAVMSRMATRAFSERVDRFLKVDLLRIDELSVIGRGSARAALIWLSVAAIICLFFASGHAPVLVIVTVLLSAGMALWIFYRSIERVHRKILATKRAELDRIRREIASLGLKASDDHTAAAKLHGLIAYETRIASVREWPFDQSTLLRVGVYVLIPAVPSLGQALVRYFVEHVHS